jgi:hypothetical protein
VRNTNEIKGFEHVSCGTPLNVMFNACRQMAALVASLFILLGCHSKRTVCEKRLDELAAAANAKIQPNELQTWANELMKRYDVGAEPNESLPSLKAFEVGLPAVSIAELPESKEKVVKIWWRAEWGVKGFYIGLPTARVMTWPESCKREWKPGIAIFYHSGE